MGVSGAGGAGGSRGAGNAAAAAQAAAAEARRRAAEEARRRAEEARRKAEAARRAAEAAKKAAEAQRRAAAEAERRAQVSKQQVAQKRQSLATTTEPRARQTLQKEVAQLHQKATTSSQDASRAHTAAVTAEQRAQSATRAAQDAERSANELAKKVGLPAPFQNILDTDTSGFDGPRPGGNKPALNGDTRTNGGRSAPQQLVADAAYHKVAAEPGGKKTFEALGIEDGKSLLTYAQGLGAGTGDTRAVADLKGALANADPKTQQHLLEQLGFLSPGLQQQVARDGDLQRVARGEGTQAEPAQAKTNEPKPTAEEVAAMPQKDKDALGAVGVKPEELVGTGPVAEEFVAAGHAALEQDWDGAFAHLEAAAAQPAAQELVAKVVSNAASHLPEGSPARELLSDSKLVGEFLQSGGDLVALSQAKTLDEAATALENVTANPELTEALKNNTYVAGQLESLGIKPEQFDEALTALPDLLRAGGALTAEPPDAAAALNHLASAAALAPNVVASAVTTAAQKLPPGPARDLLTDPTLMAEVARLAPELIGTLASATPEEALTRLGGLASDGKLQTALLANPTVSKALTDLGITDPALQKEALAALPHVLNAAAEMTGQPPDYQEALRHLAKAAQTAPGLAANLMGAAAEKLPEGDPARELLTDEALMKEVLEGAPAVLDKLLTGDVPGALTELSALAEDPELQKELSENPVVTSALDTLGVPADQRDEALKALPELLKAAAALSQQPEPDVKGALRHLGAAAQQIPELGATLVANAAARLPDTDPAKKLLTDTALMTEVLKQGGDVMELLLTDKVDEALGQLAGILDNEPLQKALANNALVKEKLTALGITDPAMQAEALKVLPDILRVGAALTENPVPWDEVLSLVGNVAKNAPLAMGAVGAQLASRIPDDSPHAYLKPLLSNGPLLQTLVEKGPEALKQLLSGDPAQMAQGVATLLADPVVSEAVATALLDSPAGAFLRDNLGITDPKELAGLLQVAPDLVALGQAIAKPDMDAALGALGRVLDHVRNTNSDLLTRMLGTVANKLGLPPEVQAVFNAAADVLGAPGGVDAFKNLVTSLAPPTDPAKFADAIGQLGGVLEGMLGSDEGKLKVENLLNALGAALPGNLGALFKDPALNKGLVQSGALGTVFQASRELVNGNLMEAVKIMGEAAMQLLGHPADQQLLDGKIPITTEGLKNFARLFKGLFDTLPNAIKNKIEAAVVSATGGLLGNIPFIGDAIDAGQDVFKLIQETQDGDLEGQLLAAGQLVVDGAKFTQVGKPFVAPLEMALTLLQAVDGIMDTVNGMKGEFSRIMTEGGDTTEYKPLDEDKRKLIQEMSKYEVPSEVALEVVTQYTEVSPAMMRDMVKLAESLGVPPEQFGEFLRRMNEEIGGDEKGGELGMFVAVELGSNGGPLYNGVNEGGVSGWTQEYFNDAFPDLAQWTREVAGPTGQDDAIIREAYKSLYGVEPTEAEIAQWRDDVTELRDSEGNPRDAYYELRDRIKDTDEYRATHPQ
jgi:hypothetical protein